MPVNVYKNKTPFTGKVVNTKRIVGPKATGETCHIVIDHKGNFPVSMRYYLNDLSWFSSLCGMNLIDWVAEFISTGRDSPGV